MMVCAQPVLRDLCAMSLIERLRMLTRRRFAVAGCATVLAPAMAPGTASPQATAAPSGWAAELDRIEAGTGGRLGVAVVDVRTGRAVMHREDERFPMCSTAKVLACGAVLSRVDAGKESLERRIRFSASDLVTYSPTTKEHVGSNGMTLRAICEAAMTLSDNTAANLIIGTLGGPAGVTGFARSLGDHLTRLDRTEPTLNEATAGDPRDTTTPKAMAASLRALVLGKALSTASRDQLAAWMTANTTGAAKLRAGVPSTWRVGDKTGSGSHGTSNDIAVLRKPDGPALVAAVYLTGAEAIPEETRSAAIAAVGRLAATAMSV